MFLLEFTDTRSSWWFLFPNLEQLNSFNFTRFSCHASGKISIGTGILLLWRQQGFWRYCRPLLLRPPGCGRDLPADLVQLVEKSLQTNVPFGIYNGISNNKGAFNDILNARDELGFVPLDDASSRGNH